MTPVATRTSRPTSEPTGTSAGTSAGTTLRTLDRAGVDALLARAAAEGWNPGVGDAAAFHAADPGGFLERIVDGRFAAGVSVVRQDAEHGFLGLYLAEPELRGRGHGLAVWRAGLARLEGLGVRSVGLDGVVDRQEDYRRSGFEYLHANFRLAGSAAELADADPELELRVPGPDDLAPSIRLDAEVGGVRRAGFLEPWFDAPPEAGRTTLVARRAGELAGVGTVRRCAGPDGPGPHKVGPLVVARDGEAGAAVAASLLRALADAANADELTVDVPAPNARAMRTLEARGFAPTFETARMYRGPAPGIDASRLWGVATLELG